MCVISYIRILHVRFRIHHKNIVCQFEVKQSQDVILFQHWALTSIIIHTLMSNVGFSLSVVCQRLCQMENDFHLKQILLL